LKQRQKLNFFTKAKPNLSLYSPYYAEASYLRRCWSGGEPFATLWKIWPAFGIRTLDLC